MEMWILWVVLALVALLIELFTSGFAVVCFSFGAFAAAVAASMGLDVAWQLSIFSIFSIVALMVVRPMALRYFDSRSKRRVYATNLDALVGRRAVVTQEVRGGEGRVSLDGDDWKVRVDDDEAVMSVGEKVEVVRVESVILIVKKL